MSTTTTNLVMAFTTQQASRLTGVSVRQLNYWARDEFYVPEIKSPWPANGSVTRYYSFRDLACLRVLNMLRNNSRVALQHLRSVKAELSHLGDDLWAKTKLHVLNRRVIFVNPETGVTEEVVSGQGVLQIPLADVTSNLEETVRAFRMRPPESHGRITGSKDPVISGTRITVRAIKELSNQGFSAVDILWQFPSLTGADVQAALNYKAAA